MRMKLPLIRRLVLAPARAPGLRYGVALLSAVLALIPTLFFSDLAESRLVVFAVDEHTEKVIAAAQATIKQ